MKRRGVEGASWDAVGLGPLNLKKNEKDQFWGVGSTFEIS